MQELFKLNFLSLQKHEGAFLSKMKDFFLLHSVFAFLSFIQVLSVGSWNSKKKDKSKKKQKNIVRVGGVGGSEWPAANEKVRNACACVCLCVCVWLVLDYNSTGIVNETPWGLERGEGRRWIGITQTNRVVGKHEGSTEALQKAKMCVHHPAGFHLKASLTDEFPRHSRNAHKKPPPVVFAAGKMSANLLHFFFQFAHICRPFLSRVPQMLLKLHNNCEVTCS